MRKLRLVGLSADGRQVVLVDDTGAEFATPADDRLRAALRGDRARLGQLEIEMDSVLRPRDIQARVRAGDSPEAVAAVAQVTVDRIMPYAYPVLAERQHIAELARRSHVRRKGTEGPSRALGEVVAERLQGRGVDALAADWDAWRREDGRWAVQATYHSGERERSALFVFDAVGRYSLAEDDEAKWLTGERQSTSKGPQPREGGRPGERRLSAVPDGDLLSLSDEERAAAEAGGTGQSGAADDWPTNDWSGDGPDDELSDDLTAVVRAVRETNAGDRVEPDDGVRESADRADAEPDVADADADGGEPTNGPQPGAVPAGEDDTPAVTATAESGTAPVRGPAGAPTEPTPRRRSKRASVPSWDEIMFGKDDA